MQDPWKFFLKRQLCLFTPPSFPPPPLPLFIFILSMFFPPPLSPSSPNLSFSYPPCVTFFCSQVIVYLPWRNAERRSVFPTSQRIIKEGKLSKSGLFRTTDSEICVCLFLVLLHPPIKSLKSLSFVWESSEKDPPYICISDLLFFPPSKSSSRHL